MHTNNYDYVADIYDIYNQSDYDIGFYLKRYRNFGGNAIELMAGTGRLSIPLIKSGIHLDCVDISGKLLTQLKNKLGREHPGTEIINSDIRSLSLSKKYDLIIIGFNSFSEIIEKCDRELILKSIYNNMSDTGEFVFSLHNPVLRRKYINSSLSLVNEYDNKDGKILFFAASKEDDKSVVDIIQLYEFYNNEFSLVNKKMLKLKFVLISRAEIESMISTAGFKIKEFYGDYEKNAFDENSSPFMIYILKK